MGDAVGDLKELIKKTLIQIGFSEVIPFVERKEQIRRVEYVLISIWVFLSLATLQGLKNRIFWLLLIIPSLILEQIVDLILCLYRHVVKHGAVTGFSVKESLNRSIYQRFDVCFFILFFALSIIPHLLQYSYLFMYIAITFFMATIFTMDKINKDKSAVEAFLSLGLGLSRIIKQVGSILNSGLGLVRIPVKSSTESGHAVQWRREATLVREL